jgi:predicted PurR-regulated permease PerM
MSDIRGMDRSRVGWLAVTVVLGGVVLAFLLAFIGTFVLGLFFYYAVRPLFRRVKDRIGSRDAAASVTLLVVVVPSVVFAAWAGLVAFEELFAFAGPELTETVVARLPVDPRTLFAGTEGPTELAGQLGDLQQFQQYLLTGLGALGTVATGLLHVTLASAFAFFLLRDGDRLARWFRNGIAGPESAAYIYLRTVDRELQTVYFGNVLTALVVVGLAFLLYNGYNLVAPAPVGLPAPTLLALLTGVGTFIPLVVGKVVYLPATGYLLIRAAAAEQSVLWAPLVFLVASFFLVDLLPQTFLRPYLAGRTLHTGLVLFSYILGVALFGWYGLFLGPLLAVLVVHFAKLVLPEVVHGDPVRPANRSPIDIGIDPLVDSGDGGEPPAPSGSAPDGPPDAQGEGDDLETD